MNLSDEDVIKLRKKKMKEEYNDIKKGFYINDKIVEFSKRVIFPDKMTIVLPNEFIVMPMNIAKMKYPAESRPQVIMTDRTGQVNITFSYFNRVITPKQIPGACEMLSKAIRNLNPANEFYEKGTDVIRDTVCSWFEYKGYAIDGQVYNMLFITSIGGFFLQGMFNCRFQDMNEWRDAAIQMRNSIIDLTIKEDN